MEYIRKFETTIDYNADKCSLTKDIMSYNDETKSCIFAKASYFKCTYNITNIDIETVLIKNINNIIEMRIDGENVTISSAYTFNSIGLHVVEFVIEKCTTLSNNPSFNGISTLVEIHFPENVKRINDSSFINCTSLKKVEFGNKSQITNWGCRPFTGCTSLEEITLPISLNLNICGDSGSSFKGCTSLKKITIPKNSKMTVMDKYLFSGVTSIEEINIQDGVSINLNNCFNDLSNLKKIYIGDSVKGGVESIYRRNLESVIVNKNNTKYDSRNNCNAIIETANNRLVLGSKNAIIPNGVEIIASGAFSLINNLTYIEIPDSVKTIENYAFERGDYLTGVTIGSGVTTIGDNAFYKQQKLSYIKIYAPTAPILGEYVFTLCNSSGTLYYPKGSDYSTWKSASVLSRWTFKEF